MKKLAVTSLSTLLVLAGMAFGQTNLDMAQGCRYDDVQTCFENKKLAVLAGGGTINAFEEFRMRYECSLASGEPDNCFAIDPDGTPAFEWLDMGAEQDFFGDSSQTEVTELEGSWWEWVWDCLGNLT